jgi:hypothetical protein
MRVYRCRLHRTLNLVWFEVMLFFIRVAGEGQLARDKSNCGDFLGRTRSIFSPTDLEELCLVSVPGY